MTPPRMDHLKVNNVVQQRWRVYLFISCKYCNDLKKEKAAASKYLSIPLLLDYEGIKNFNVS